MTARLVSGHLPWAQEDFTPTLGQVSFIVSNLPKDVVSIEFYVNGVLYEEGVGADYVVSGATITWQNTFVLRPKDVVIVRYQ